MSILSHVEADAATRDEFLQAVSAQRRLGSADYTDKQEDRERDETVAVRLNEPAFAAMARDEEFILTVTENGFGKRTSAYEYRITRRGGQGIDCMDLRRDKKTASTVVAAFPVLESDQIVMVTDTGQLIRCPVNDVRAMGRKTRGVTLFKIDPDERVVSVTRLRDVDEDEDDEDGAATDETKGVAEDLADGADGPPLEIAEGSEDP